MSASPEVIAVRYGTSLASRAKHFHRYHTYGEPDGDLRLDFYFWLVRSEDETVLVDTGISTREQRYAGVFTVDPLDALAMLGVRPADVSKVVVSHLHFDHSGNLSLFPDSQFVVQRAELEFWTGTHGSHPPVRDHVDWNEIGFLQQAQDAGRVTVVDGDAEVAAGVRVQLVGGHTPGQQLVIVEGERDVVLASDAMHFYEEMERDLLFGTFTDMPGMYRTYEKLRALRDGGSIVVPGHDPRVMQEFAPVAGAAEKIAVLIR